jgi:hypothetical protein
MSHQDYIPSSSVYRAELARSIAEWIPRDQLLPPGSPSGYVSIKIVRFDEAEGLDFVVRDPTGEEERWSVTWRGLLAYGALKQSES